MAVARPTRTDTSTDTHAHRLDALDDDPNELSCYICHAEFELVDGQYLPI